MKKKRSTLNKFKKIVVTHKKKERERKRNYAKVHTVKAVLSFFMPTETFCI